VDVTRTALPEGAVKTAALVAFFLPMHTATRLALPVIDRVRAANPNAHLCAYGLYAPLNEPLLRERGIRTILGPEFESDLLAIADGGELAAAPGLQPGETGPRADRLALPRVSFLQPDRSGLPPLAKYASLQAGETSKVVGYTEATRGCKHLCRHCPIVPVYGGRFRAVPAEIVLADIRAQVAAGAAHITFGDPDFLNGPTHAAGIITALAAEFPGLSYDVTIKVEHLRRHGEMLQRLKDTGCAFVTTAVESFDDNVLEKLRKGHTFDEFQEVVARSREVGLPLSPTFVAFTPWTTIDGYLRMLREIDRLGLVGAVAPIQYAIRLLVPDGSLLLELDDLRAVIDRFDGGTLTHVWRHPDSRVDALQGRLERLVGGKVNVPREAMFDRVWELAHDAAGIAAPPRDLLPSRATVPYLNEPWYC
jgi:radical SAM superfamily enzyme YgiQ (UPF0313 family)